MVIEQRVSKLAFNGLDLNKSSEKLLDFDI